MTAHAVDDDRARRPHRHLPARNIVGISADRANNHPVVGVERRASADIDDNGRGIAAEPGIEAGRGNGKAAFVHDRAPSHCE
jgi:hypothetical protein